MEILGLMTTIDGRQIPKIKKTHIAEINQLQADLVSLRMNSASGPSVSEESLR